MVSNKNYSAMTNPLRMSLLREQVEGSKSAVARYWIEANQEQRRAICYTAEHPEHCAELAITDMPTHVREDIRQAVIRLKWQSLFHDCMSYYEWHAGCLPARQEKKTTKKNAPANRLEQKRNVLKEAQSANSGQNKAPITGARHT